MVESNDGCRGEVSQDPLLRHPALRGFWKSERRAILRHRAILGSRRGTEVSLEIAVDEWECGPGREWRVAKCRLDADRQHRLILEHKYLESQKLGYDIGLDRAAIDWVCRFARGWREWWENQDEADPFVSAERDPACAA